MNNIQRRMTRRPVRPSLSMALRCVLAGSIALLVMGPCAAHHSFSMFDQAKSVTLIGTVKEVQWSNPHCYIQMLVPSASASTEWSIEMHSPLGMYRLGWRPGSLKAGDKVTLVINPLRDGTKGGRLLYAINASGKTLRSDKGPENAEPQS